MASRCQHCAAFSIELVLEGVSPYGGLSYSHYERMSELSKSATSGCDMCQLMVASLKKERFLNNEEQYGRPDLYSYLLHKESLGLDACFELHLRLEGFSRQHAHYVILQLKSRRDEFVVLEFWLGTSRQKPFNIGNARVGQFRKVGVPNNQSLAKARLEECLASHKDCQQLHTPTLPDRVIDTGTGVENCRLIHPRGIRAQYIALSHCWGGQIDFRLERKTFAAFCGGLAISKLAKNFQHAIEITRSLGIRYLWVDCLCIIQDSTADWLDQSKKMASVYSQATLTIYAMESPTSQHGILTQENSSMIKEMPSAQPVCVRVYKASTTTDSEAQLELVYDAVGKDSVRLVREGILASRGWALQEYALAPRRLLFGTKKVYWECLRGSQTMDGFTLTDYRRFTYKFNSFRAQIHLHPPRSSSQRQGLLNDYYDLVRVYSARQLTRSSDKLPAFSAIAQSAHEVIGGDYIAGLWTEDLHEGLLWVCEKPRQHRPLPTSYQAPSWSWARSNGDINFKLPCGLHPAALPLQASWKIGLVDSTNYYGQIQSAQLNLTVWTKRLHFFSSAPTPVQGFIRDSFSLVYLDFDVFEDSTKVLDNRFLHQGESEIYIIVVNRTENWVPREYLLMAVIDDYFAHAHRIICLAIGRDSNATGEAYERVGLLKVSVSNNWQESWSRQSITLV